jgi:hypothetical protein
VRLPRNLVPFRTEPRNLITCPCDPPLGLTVESRVMRTIEEYRIKALEFDDMAETAHSELKRCYRELAQAYRDFAETRELALRGGPAKSHMLPRSEYGGRSSV